MSLTKSKRLKKPSKKAWEWSPVDPLSVLTVTKDHKIMLGTQQITETEMKRLQDEAKVLKNMRIWHVLQETVRQKAIEMGFVEADTWERAMSGKMMLHNLGILKSIVEVLTFMPPVHSTMMPIKPARPGPKVM